MSEFSNIRVLIQDRLDGTGIDCGPAKPDGMVEEGQTYFGYELSENNIQIDFDRNQSMEIVLTGRLVRKNDPTEDTLQIIDDCMEELKAAFKDLNLRYSYRDVSDFQDGFKKIAVTGTARYNELNKGII